MKEDSKCCKQKASHVIYYNDRKIKKDLERLILRQEATTLLLVKGHKEGERHESHHLRGQ